MASDALTKDEALPNCDFMLKPQIGLYPVFMSCNCKVMSVLSCDEAFNELQPKLFRKY